MSTIDKIKEIIADQLALSAAEIGDESKVKDDLGADSLDMVELVMKLEEEFSLKIADEDLQQIITVADIASYIQRRA